MIEIPEITLPLPRIAAGCMQYGGKWSDAPLQDNAVHEARAAVDAALELGINFFDHADIYCRGKSAEAFGRILNDAPALRDVVIIQSKCGIRLPDDPAGAPGRYDFSADHIIAATDRNLQQLGCTHLDSLLLHRPDPLVEPEEVAAAFDELHRAGKVLAFGVSNHTPAQISLLQRYLRQPLRINQMQFSLLHTDMLDGGLLSKDLLPRPVGEAGTIEYCREHDILIQAWAPLGSGRLFAAADAADKKLRRFHAVIDEISADHDTVREVVALAWILRHPAAIQPIIGTRRPERLRTQAACRDLELSREEWYRLFVAGRGEFLP
jgi:predicted oxidoreductase